MSRDASAYFGKRLYTRYVIMDTCMCKHAHLYRWQLADTAACVDHAQPATPTVTDNLVVLIIVQIDAAAAAKSDDRRSYIRRLKIN